MKSINFLRLCAAWMLVISVFNVWAGPVRPRQDADPSAVDAPSDSPLPAAPDTTPPASDASSPVSTPPPDTPPAPNTPDNNSTLTDSASAGSSPAPIHSNVLISNSSSPSNTSDPSAMTPALNGTDSGPPNNASAPAGGNSTNTTAPGNMTNPDLTGSNSTSNDTEFGFERPVYLTFLYFLDGRFIDKVTGRDVLPTKAILTIAGDGSNPATRIMLDRCDGQPCLRADRLQGDSGFDRNTYAKSETFQIIPPSNEAIRQSEAKQPSGLGRADNHIVAKDSMLGLARMKSQAFGAGSDVGSSSGRSSSILSQSDKDVARAFATLENIRKSYAPADGSALSDESFNNNLARTLLPRFKSRRELSAERNLKARARLNIILNRYRDLSPEQAAKYAPEPFFRDSEAGFDGHNTNNPSENPRLQPNPVVDEPANPDARTQVQSDPARRVTFREEVTVLNGDDQVDRIKIDQMAEDKRLAIAHNNWVQEQAYQDALKTAATLKEVSGPPVPVDPLADNPFAAVLAEEAGSAPVDPAQIKSAAKIPIDSFPEKSESSLSSLSSGESSVTVSGGAFGEGEYIDTENAFGYDSGNDDARSAVSDTTDSSRGSGSSSSSGSSERPQGSSDLVVAANTESSVARARLGGVLKVATLVAKQAIAALNVAGLVAGAAFIVVDFVNGNLVGGGLALAGLIAGVGIGLAFELATTELGPVGWLIGGLVSLLFSIIPGLAGPAVDMPSPLDIQGILQWSFFRNTTHTGNEKCRTDSPGVKANPNCTAVFGPGLIARALNISPYNASILLIHYNGGYAMSIDDLSAVFQYINPRHRDHTANEIALIDCIGNTQGPSGNEENPTAHGDTCENPSYIINWDLITIPVINQTAKQVFSRIAPAPNADCRVVTYPEGQFFPDYNLTATGLPTAIACGIQPGLNISGTLVDATTQAPIANGSITSSGSNSTDHVSGAYIAPPPKSSFAPPPSTACLADTVNKTLCLPPGTYPVPSSSLINLDKLRQLTLSAGAGINANYVYSACRGGCLTTVNTNYTINTTVADPIFHAQQINKDFGFLANNKVTNPHPISVFADPSQPSPRGFCIYGGTNYTGDFACFGLGGDNLPPQWQNKAKSLHVIQGTKVEIFGTSYGDVGGTPLAQDEPDLSDLILGNSTFAQKFVAAWAS